MMLVSLLYVILYYSGSGLSVGHGYGFNTSMLNIFMFFCVFGGRIISPYSCLNMVRIWIP